MAQSPAIVLQPQDKTTCPGTCADLHVAAAPVGTAFNYQWQQKIAGAFQDIPMDASEYHSQNDTFRVCLDALDSAEFRCVVSNTAGADTSNVATVSADSCLPPIADFTYTVFSDTVCFTNTSTGAKNVLWNFGDNAQSSDMDPCHGYGAEQMYYVRLYVYNDFGNDSIEKLVSTVGFDELKLQDEVRAYPNPASEKLTIAFPKDLRPYEVFITDAIGRSHQVNANMPTPGKLEVGTAELRAGFYHVHLVSATGHSVKPFIKN